MRQPVGHDLLRALLYMDEVYGYLPPTANPPSKQPLLTLLKQARAFGVGVLLATQNPVDLDYKALSNAGDVVRRAAADRSRQGARARRSGAGRPRRRITDSTGRKWDRMLSGLGNRVFLMNNTHEDHPVVMASALVPELPARPAHPNPNQDVDGPATRGVAAGRATGGRRRGPATRCRGSGGGRAGGQLASGAAAKPVIAKAIPEFFLANRPNPAGHPVVALPHVLRGGGAFFRCQERPERKEKNHPA